MPEALAALPVEFTATYLELVEILVKAACVICLYWLNCEARSKSWLPFTASVLVAVTAPAATLVSATAVAAPTPPSVTLVCAALSYCTALLATDATDCSWLTFTASVGALPAATPVS